jgi:hypothetical protein
VDRRQLELLQSRNLQLQRQIIALTDALETRGEVLREAEAGAAQITHDVHQIVEEVGGLDLNDGDDGGNGGYNGNSNGGAGVRGGPGAPRALLLSVVAKCEKRSRGLMARLAAAQRMAAEVSLPLIGCLEVFIGCFGMLICCFGKAEVSLPQFPQCLSC